MSRMIRERMSFSLRDPLYGLLHQVYKYVLRPYQVNRVVYRTSCGLHFSVDDVNTMTMAMSEPTCLQCIVAVPLF